jgi:MoaA/NifB/PqqE/SkfB family radical SAM enzyme
MCNVFKYPTKPAEEIPLEVIRKLPEMEFTNITGGEPFLRDDIEEIVGILMEKTNRIVISTNGYFTDRILSLCRKFPKVGIRISIEGLQETNDRIRGIPDGFAHGYGTLQKLVEMGHPDVGFGMTVQDINADDLVPLYKISDKMGMEFATATLHNSFYFHKSDNRIDDRLHVAENFAKLNNELLSSRSPKKWFRAYFNHGLINYIYGNKRLLPCDMSRDAFFIDPFCDVVPCNGTEEKMVMGNLREQSWEELWHSEQAESVRRVIRKCPRNCWMIGSASPAMHRYIWVPAWWVIKHKLLKGGRYSLSENRFISGAPDEKSRGT